jgi:hypothetical protein
MLLNGVSDKVVLGNIGNVKSIAFRIKFKTTSEKILEKAANSGLIYTTTGTLTAADFANKYINSVSGTSIVAGQWLNICLTSSTDVVFSAAILGLNNTTYGAFEIADLRFWNRELTVQEIKNYNNQYVKPYIIDDMSDYAVLDTNIRNFIKGTGTYVVEELTANDPVLKHLTKGTKYLRNTVAGTIALPSNQSTGTWEWDWMKGADGNRMDFDIMSNNILHSTSNSYFQSVTANEVVQFRSLPVGSTYFATATSYITNNTWYRTKIARLQSAGVFLDIPTLQVSNLVNGVSYPYPTFTSNGKYGFIASNNGISIAIAATVDELSIVSGVRYLVEFDLSLLSGNAPDVDLRDIEAGNLISNTVIPLNGKNSIVLTATSTTTGILRFKNSAITNSYVISGLTIRRIYDANSFLVLIKGGIFGNEYVPVSVVGGSGTNPVVDATYTTSNYFVLDLDAGDRFGNLVMIDGIKQ